MAHDPSAFIQEYFRIRSGDTVGLNVDSGWAAAENTNANIGTGLEFRIRFKVRETAAGADTTGFKLQVNHNSGGFVDVDVNLGVTTPATQAVVSSQFNDGDAATELLTNTTTYVNGEGLETAASSSFTLTSEETEFEWCLLIMGFYDGPSQVDNGDTLEFRVVESDGTVFTGTYTNPTITVDETAGYIGGTYVETPSRIGPFADSNGNLYFIIEPSESDPKFLMIKSTDGGDTWREQDGVNRPTTEDLESVDAVIVDETIHIVHQPGSDVVYDKFRMSDHATNPDTWELTDEIIITGISETDQAAAIEVRSDTTVVAFYRRTDGNENIKYKIRSGGGVWGSENNLDSTASVEFTAVMCAKGASDKIHIFYKDTTNEDIYHKSLDSGDTLSARELVEADPKQPGAGQQWSMTPAAFWDAAGAEKVMIVILRDTDDLLYSIVITDDGVPEARKQASDATCQNNQGTSRQPVADLTVDPTADTSYMLYARLADDDIYRNKAVNDGGWGTDVEQVDAINGDWVRSKVFIHNNANGGARVLGFCYDDGSGGGTGRIFYDEFLIPGGPAFPSPRRHPGRNLLLRL